MQPGQVSQCCGLRPLALRACLVRQSGRSFFQTWRFFGEDEAKVGNDVPAGA